MPVLFDITIVYVKFEKIYPHLFATEPRLVNHNSLPAKAVLLLLRFLKRRWHEVTEEFFTEGEFARRQKKIRT